METIATYTSTILEALAQLLSLIFFYYLKRSVFRGSAEFRYFFFFFFFTLFGSFSNLSKFMDNFLKYKVGYDQTVYRLKQIGPAVSQQ